MKTLFFTSFLVLAFSVTGFAQKCTEYTIPGDAFVFCPPAGWKSKEDKAAESVEFESPSSKSPIPTSITILYRKNTAGRESTALNLIKATLGSDQFEEPRLVRLFDFKLPSGLEGTTLFFHINTGGLKLAYIYMLIDGPNNTNLAFLIVGPGDGEDKTTAKLVDDAIGTLRAK